MIDQRFQETPLIRYVLENVEQKNDVESFTERCVLLEDVIAIGQSSGSSRLFSEQPH